MGQQQLLLLVLGIVIVGLAVVVGIQAFSENQKKANADALVNDTIRIASDAQAWSLKPAAFGGPASGGIEGATLGKIGVIQGTGTEYSNTNGKFTITAGTTCILIVGEGKDATNPNKIYTKVKGTTANDVSTQVNGAAVATCN